MSGYVLGYLVAALVCFGLAALVSKGYYRATPAQAEDERGIAIMSTLVLGVVFALMLGGAYLVCIDADNVSQILVFAVAGLLIPVAATLGQRSQLWPWWIFAVTPIVIAVLVGVTMTWQSMHFEPLFSLEK
jgi:hypothetical protein